MLEVAAETLIGESGPGDELVHALRVLIPVWVLGHELLEWGRKRVWCLGVLEEENSSVSITETLDLALVLGEDWRREGLLGLLHANVPQLVVLSTEENDGSARLNGEWRRSMLDGVVDTHDNAVIRDGRLLGERKDRAADLDGREEWSLVCHFDFIVLFDGLREGIFCCRRKKMRV
jgi:hypothetical protein